VVVAFNFTQYAAKISMSWLSRLIRRFKAPRVSIMEDEQNAAERRAAAMAKSRQWDPLYEKIYQDPSQPYPCPFCGKCSVRASWALYSQEPRGASMDVWCESCGEGEHVAALLPDHALDSYPPGVKKVEAEMTKRIFDVGKKRKWW
jgi:hypothetical protein